MTATRTLTTGAVAAVVALALVASAVAAVPAASLAGGQPAVGGSVQAQQNNTTAGTQGNNSSVAVPGNVTAGFANNSTLQAMSNEELVDRVNSLDEVLSQTHDEYLRAYQEVQSRLNETDGETNASLNESLSAAGNETPSVDNSTLEDMSKSELVATVNTYQDAIRETQDAYLSAYRQLQMDLNERQANGSNDTQLANLTQQINTTEVNETNTSQHTRNATNATEMANTTNATQATATTDSSMSTETGSSTAASTGEEATATDAAATDASSAAGSATEGGAASGGSTTTSSNGPGFGVVIAVVGLLAAAGIALRRE